MMNKEEAYASLSDLIFKGFLTTELRLDGKLFIFKTVNERELDLVKIYAGDPKAPDFQVKFNIYYLILSLFMADNKNILSNRSESVPDLYDYFLTLPILMHNKMINELAALGFESYECLKFLEGFCYTNSSRNAWRTLDNKFPSSSEFTGISGTSELGLNVHQESWIILNKTLDEEDSYNKEFSLALLISSASNPKGSKGVRNQFDAAKKMGDDRKTKLAKEGFIDKKKWQPDGWAASVDTVEDLVAELEREMTGVKDKHDIFIENYMAKLRGQAEKRVQEAEDQIKKLQEGRDNVFIEGEQRVMTDDEVKALMSKKAQTTTVVREEMASHEDKDRFLKKIGSKILTGK